MKYKFMHNSYLNPALVRLPFENDLLVLVFRLNLQFQICPIGKKIKFAIVYILITWGFWLQVVIY